MGRTQGFLVPGMECLLCSLHWSEGSKGEEIKKYGREGVSVWRPPLSALRVRCAGMPEFTIGLLATRPVSRSPGDLSESPCLDGGGVSTVVTSSL